MSSAVTIGPETKGEAQLRLLCVPAWSASAQLLVCVSVGARQSGNLRHHVGVAALEAPRHDEVIKFCASNRSAVVPTLSALPVAEHLGSAPLLRAGGACVDEGGVALSAGSRHRLNLQWLCRALNLGSVLMKFNRLGEKENQANAMACADPGVKPGGLRDLLVKLTYGQTRNRETVAEFARAKAFWANYTRNDPSPAILTAAPWVVERTALDGATEWEQRFLPPTDAEVAAARETVEQMRKEGLL